MYEIFTPGGLAYVPLPRVKLERAASDVLRAILAWANGRAVVSVSDSALANALEEVGKCHSRRFIQKGLKLLEDGGLIQRRKVRNPTRWGVEFVRQIVLNIRLAGTAKPERKSKNGPSQRPKKFVHPCARGGAVPTHGGALSLEGSGEQGENSAGGGGEPHGGGTPPPAGGEPDAGGAAPETPEEAEAKRLAALAEFRATVARGRAEDAARRDEGRARSERPGPAPRVGFPAAPDWPRAAVVAAAGEGDRVALEILADAATSGDGEAGAALEAIRAGERAEAEARADAVKLEARAAPGILRRLFGRRE